MSSGETLPDPEAGAPPPALIAPGAVVDRYVIVRELGAGSFGVVFEARDPELGRKVAIKVLRATAQDQAADRFQREARAIARLNHPNVVTLHDVGRHEGRPFIAMELVDGTSLREWLAQARPSRAEILGVMRQAARGLSAAHAVGIIHRDFKPDNVLVGRDGRIRVADFGLARATDGASADPADAFAKDITRTGVIVGTPAYMAPEQLRGAATDARTDQYAFCLVLQEALTGEPALDAAGKRRPVPAGVPARLRRAIDRGLATDPADRHASIDDLLAEILPSRRRRFLAIGAIAFVVLAALTGWLAVSVL